MTYARDYSKLSDRSLCEENMVFSDVKRFGFGLRFKKETSRVSYLEHDEEDFHSLGILSFLLQSIAASNVDLIMKLFLLVSSVLSIPLSECCTNSRLPISL